MIGLAINIWQALLRADGAGIPSTAILLENGDDLVTEAGDPLVTES